MFKDLKVTVLPKLMYKFNATLFLKIPSRVFGGT